MWGFKVSKIKPQLKMAVHRFQINSNKKICEIKNQKRNIAKLLAEKPNPKEEKARIRAEALIREDGVVEAYEILQLNCDLLAERIKLIESQKECPPDMLSVVSTVIWASARVDIPELIEIRKQLKSKYGSRFVDAALNNSGGVVNERVFAKLSVDPPPALLVQTYLEKIADEFDVDWKPKVALDPDEMPLPMKAPTGASIPSAIGSGYADADVNENTTLPPIVHATAVPYIPSQPMVTNENEIVYEPPKAPKGNFDKKPQAKPKHSAQDDDIVTLEGCIPPPTAPTAHNAEGNEIDKAYLDLKTRFDHLKK